MNRLKILFTICMAFGCAYCVFGCTTAPPDTVFYLGRDTFKTPVYAFYGKEKGPVMFLDGGIHGDEVAAQYACDSIINHITVTKGTLYVLPRTNLLACRDTVRFKNVDLNRTFPGDTCWVDYEYTLSYLFMQMIDSLKPDMVINLHEARTHVKLMTAKNKNLKAFGQTLITIEEPYSSFLYSVQTAINAQLDNEETLFKLHRFPFMACGSLDNIYYRLKIQSYTVETWREYELPDRVRIQTICALEFMKKLGLQVSMQ